ncbi:MAG: response regulator [Promethearchaeota archaeon]|nr:MAG: response regulator [Candidatus Lokiarchaeota archaeon]
MMEDKIGKVLIVEDDVSLLNLYEMIIKAHGYKVVGKAKNGEEAVDIYKKLPEKPDVVLMDHRMPIKSGLEASKEILEHDPEAKIIIATADQEIKTQMETLPIQSFKNKPFSNERLINNIQKALDKADSKPLIKS